MGLREALFTFLLSLSPMQLGTLPETSTWQIVRKWEPAGPAFVLEAKSTEIAKQCKSMPEGWLVFPRIINSIQQIYVDGYLVNSHGNPKSHTVFSIYGSPNVQCSQIIPGKEIVWVARSHSRDFSRIDFWPSISQSRSIRNVFSETANIMGAGSFLVIAVLVLIFFWGKIPNRVTVAMFFTNVFFSLYFLGTVPGFFQIDWPIWTAQRFGDFFLCSSTATFFYVLKTQKIIGRKIYGFYLTVFIVAALLILSGRSNDEIQFGTSLLFPFFIGSLVVAIVTLIAKFNQAPSMRTGTFQLLSMATFAVAGTNDILIVTGVTRGYELFSFAPLGAMAFITMAVHERIMAAYRELAYLKVNLQTEVEQKTRELSEKNIELQNAVTQIKTTQAELIQSSKLAALGTLSAGIAHEINNALNYVYGSIKPLEKLINALPEHPNSEKIGKLLRVMNEGLQLTFEIIKSLKNYTGLNQAKFNDIDLNLVAKSAATILRSKMRDVISISVEIPAGLKVFGNVVGLNQVLMNLMSNAMDAMPDGGKLTISAKEEKGSVEISVADTGTGMPEEVRNRIFDPFFTTKEVGNGTGLGLYIVRNEVERHKGSISVASELGKGTVFKILLPMNTEQEGVAA